MLGETGIIAQQAASEEGFSPMELVDDESLYTIKSTASNLK
jgi:hypothetical protein